MNLNLLSNDELLKLRSAKIGQTTQNQEAIELPKTTQNQQTIQLPKITQEQLKVWQEQDKPIQSIVLPFSEPLLNMFSGLFGTRTNADDELKNAKTTEQQVSAINNILSKKAASKPIFRDNTSDKEQALKDISDKLYTQNGSRIVQKGNEYFIKDKDGKYTNIDDGILNSIGRIARDNIASVIGTMIGARNGSIIKGAIGAGAGGAIDMKTASNYMGQSTVNPKELAQRMGEEALLSLGGDMAIKALTSKPAINTLKGTAKTALNIADKGLAGVGARHILSQNIGGAGAALKANLGGDHEFRNALESAQDALGADLDNFVRKDIKTINKTSDNRYIQKGIDIANSAINKANETLKGLNVGRADAELLLSALGHENGVKNILDSVANNPQSAQKIAEISSNLNKSFSGSINEQLAKFETQTPKDSFKNSFNQVKKDYADTKDFLVKNSNYQSDFKELSDNLATILSDTQNINTRGVFNALNGGGNLENLLNAKNAINEQLGYIIKADFKSSSDFINQKALNEAKSLIDNEINTALKNDENLINLYKSANGDYATMKNIVDSNLMSQISRDGKTSLEALNAMIKSNENINGVTLNDFLSSLGAKDRAIAEANIIKGLMEKNSVNGVVDFRALNQNLNSLDFGSEFAKELKSQILNRQALLNNTSDILNALGSKVVKSKSMSQGISTDPLKRAETMKANFVVEKLKPLIPRLGNNEALKLHLNRAILNANGDFKLAIKNIDNIPDGNLPTPTRNLLNEFKEAVKEIEKQVVKADNQPNLANQANSGNIDSLTKQISYLQNAIKGDGFVTYPNSARQETAINQNFNIQEWVKNMSGVISDEWRANLTKLANNHPEMFRSEADVFRVIKEIKDNPTHFFKNYDDDIALIGKKLNNNKDGNIGIVKDSGEIIHANKNRSGDLDRLQRKQLKNYEKDGAIAGTPAPATTRPNNGVEGEIIKNRTNAKTIPNQSIKEAETMAKTAEPTAEPKTAENTQGNSKILTNQDIKEQISKWDLNAPKQTLITNKIDGEELEKLNEHFKFKGNYPLTRQIDSEHIKHALNHHGDEKTEALRGQKAITLDDISNYENYAKTADIKEYSDKKVISKKQINGHFVVVEEALTGKNRLNFVSMWYVKGKIKDVAPVSTPKNDLDRTLSNRYDSSNSTPKEIKSQEPTPQAKAQTTATQPTSQVKEPTDNRKYFKNLDKEQYEQVVYETDIGRSRLYNISSLSTSANIWAQDFSDKYLMAKYNATKDEVAKARAKWQDRLIKNGIDTAPIKEFGINYVEFYHAKDLAIKKLLTERQGQVAGAFHKDGRDITISWGEAKMANGDIKGYGLSKIEAKHLDDFAIFEGSTPQEKMANGINEIIEKGKIVSDSGIDTIWYKKGDSYFLVGLSKGFKGVGDDSWVVTSYKKTNISENKKAEINEVLNGSGNSKTLSAYAEIKSSKTPELTTAENSTTSNIKSQDPTADAPSELYKAHRKAQKAKEAETTAKTAEPQEPKVKAEPTPQATKEANKKAKLDEELAKNKAYVEGLEREAIDKIEALNNFNKTAEKGASIPLKSIVSQAEQELKEFARLRAKETGASQERINNIKIKSLDDLKNQLDSLGIYLAKTKDKEGQALLNKYVEILNDISEARLNQRAIKKQNETQKDDLIKGVVDSLKGLQIVGLRNLSNFLVKYGKTDEFMTKANPKWKNQFDEARALMERDQNITPIKEFGTNYAEFYRDGQNAIKKLLTERQGQVAGAFHKDGLGDIDLVWGEFEVVKGEIKGYGLSKIVEKHLKDFSSFDGDTAQQKMANGIAEIIEKGEIKIDNNSRTTIVYNKNDKVYKIGLKQNWQGNPTENKWIVTAYDDIREANKIINSKGFTKGETLPLNSKPNSTPKEIKSQAQKVEQKAKQYAKWLSQADKIPPQAPDELYKAYDKAKRT
ncbi:DUF3519 domain-containing protein [Campylobacter devanensis]|uniref:putative barnase/colicin E5 family endoribonuclease n=1 Tax=Campylobacter devanensis TaxID=3161138 RepID=UPI000A339D0E|nr:DUF3519 domain-containing protein [Campylobacter sp. P0187]